MLSNFSLEEEAITVSSTKKTESIIMIYVLISPDAKNHICSNFYLCIRNLDNSSKESLILSKFYVWYLKIKHNMFESWNTRVV